MSRRAPATRWDRETLFSLSNEDPAASALCRLPTCPRVNRVRKLSHHPVAERARRTAAARTPRQRWLGMVAICGATFMLLVDVTIVQVALPTIQRAFHASFTDLQWVISAYALTLSAFILTSGSLADRFGRTRIFVAGVAVFTVSSVMCGAATGPVFLNLARALQGVGGAAMFATSLALIGQEFHGSDRAKAIGIWGATVGGAVAIGPLVGGAITSGLGWRWIFFINVPVGVATVVMAIRLLPNVGDPEARRVDAGGLLTFSGVLFLLNFALLRGTAKGWSDPLIVACFAGSALLLVAFIVVETRQVRPMFDMSLFRNAGFCGVSIATFAIGMGMFAMYPYITLYLQNDLGYSPFAGGLRMLPSTLLAFAVPLATRRLTEKIPAGVVLGSSLMLTAVGLATMDMLTIHSGWTALLAGLILTGLGVGLANPSIAKIGLGVVHPARTGMASGISNTMRIAGLATGIAAIGAAFQDRISSGLTAVLHTVPRGLAEGVAAGGTQAAYSFGGGRPQITGPFIHAAGVAFAGAMNEIFVIGAVIVAAGALAAFALVRARHFFGASPGAGSESGSRPDPASSPEPEPATSR